MNANRTMQARRPRRRRCQDCGELGYFKTNPALCWDCEWERKNPPPVLDGPTMTRREAFEYLLDWRKGIRADMPATAADIDAILDPPNRAARAAAYKRMTMTAWPAGSKMAGALLAMAE